MLGIGGVRCWRVARYASARIAEQRSAYEEAIAALARAREARRARAPTTPTRWFVELSSIVRDYLERRYEIRAPELTTEEFLPEAVAREGADAPSTARSSSQFLERCDRVKFAGYRPDPSESIATLDAARAFVEDTRLRDEPPRRRPHDAGLTCSASSSRSRGSCSPRSRRCPRCGGRDAQPGRVVFSSLRALPLRRRRPGARALAWLPDALIVLAVIALAIALAGPRAGDKSSRVRRDGIAIMMAVDVSGSMRALDLVGDGASNTGADPRLDAVKRVVRAVRARRRRASTAAPTTRSGSSRSRATPIPAAR